MLKKYLKYKKAGLLALILSGIIITSCSPESNPAETEDDGKNAEDYYPGKTGSSWTYSIERTNEGSDNLTPAGTKVIKFNDVTSSSGIDRIIQEETITFNSNVISSLTAVVRRTAKGLYIDIDSAETAGFIPDSLLNSYPDYLGLRIDSEAQTISVPFFVGKNWKVFVISVLTKAGNVDAFNIKANIEGTEKISVLNQIKEAQKIKCTVTFRIPKETTGTPEFTTRTYNAFYWYAEGTGLARYEGNAFISSILSGSSINIADTNKTVRQILTNCEIKE